MHNHLVSVFSTQMYSKVNGSTPIHFYCVSLFSVYVIGCFMVYTNSSILALLYVILLQRLSISIISLCIKQSYSSITHISFLIPEGHKGMCSPLMTAICQSQFLKGYNSYFFFTYIFQFQRKHSVFPPNLEHPQAQRCHKPNLVSAFFLYLIILKCASHEFYCDQWNFIFICIPWVYNLEHPLKDKVQHHMS